MAKILLFSLLTSDLAGAGEGAENDLVEGRRWLQPSNIVKDYAIEKTNAGQRPGGAMEVMDQATILALLPILHSSSEPPPN
ncbi:MULTISPECIES: hypothetical protein [unclassified Bradyrhizobium]|uniref:hypothetical protein n=1 Tax=unclassified Bradyrhizobium TaxID=2631580 RepID=UPI00093ACCCF|nr:MULTISPECIES: hypothetical protein [unclassified Bradyrhizobium]OKO70639.1 hypothetical protein AC630_34610 [Bradyrhizobium sp. AS23.2]OKO88300.1 hypothetical protein AC629_10240 [Bradyrhizobium sp. NAS80.1]